VPLLDFVRVARRVTIARGKTLETSAIHAISRLHLGQSHLLLKPALGALVPRSQLVGDFPITNPPFKRVFRLFLWRLGSGRRLLRLPAKLLILPAEILKLPLEVPCGRSAARLRWRSGLFVRIFSLTLFTFPYRVGYKLVIVLREFVIQIEFVIVARLRHWQVLRRMTQDIAKKNILSTHGLRSLSCNAYSTRASSS
jgi:hypothetical protein